ncbi:hypothetical protein F4780DRAFT_233566 [Xylariomycetidae sp. FL0641]|nr:hypothetical protein F4780DRAFT_233566 [Xylariomycetidae sp. FL0641]
MELYSPTITRASRNLRGQRERLDHSIPVCRCNVPPSTTAAAAASAKALNNDRPRAFHRTHSPLRTDAFLSVKMQPAVSRITTQLVARRAFHATRARLSSPYHYPEGPYSNLPFNTKTRFFAVRYWSYCVVGFFLPFGIAVWQTKKPKA